MRKYAMGGGRYSTKHTRKMGMDAEKLFENILKKLNIKYTNATEEEEKIEHWDFRVNKSSKINSGRYEIKSAKAKARGLEKDYNIIYIEFKSVGGNKGWIFGDADYIAFEEPDGFIIFSRKKLLKYISVLFEFMSYSNKSGQIGTFYSRKNRNDLVGIYPKQLLLLGVEHYIISNITKN